MPALFLKSVMRCNKLFFEETFRGSELYYYLRQKAIVVVELDGEVTLVATILACECSVLFSSEIIDLPPPF